MHFLEYLISKLVWSLIAVGILFVLYLYVAGITHFREVPGVEYLKSNMLFGEFYKVFVNKQNFVLKFRDLYDTIKGPFGGFYLFTKPVIMIRDPDLINQILISDFEKFTDRGLLTTNVLVFKGDKWRTITDKMPPNMLKDMQTQAYNVLEKHCLTLQKHLERVIPTNDIVDVRELMIRYATAAMTSIVFSNDVDSINTPDDMFCKMGRILAKPKWSTQMRSMFTLVMPTIAKKLRIRMIDPEIEQFLTRVVKRTLELRESGKVVKQDYIQLLAQLRNAGKFNVDGKWDVKPISGKFKMFPVRLDKYLSNPVLYTLSEKSKHLTIDEVVTHTFLFYAYEFHSASSALELALYEIARNKEVLSAIQIEIDEVVNTSRHVGIFGYRMSPELVGQMTYVDQVVNEVLRKYPSVPIVVRSPRTVYKIPNTEIILDENQEIFIPIYALHHDPKYYARGNDFLPHLHAFNINTHECGTFFPFGDSSPDWIQSGFSYLQIKIAIVAICLKFNIELAPECNRDVIFRNAGALKIWGDLKLRFTLRNEGFCRQM